MNPTSAHQLDHLLSFVIEQPWAITPPMAAIVANILGRRLAGLASDTDLRAQSTAGARRPAALAPPGVAVLPVHGVIAPRMNLLSDVSGGTSYQALGGELRIALADPDVRTIVLDVNSPGGSVAGAPEFAAALLSARVQKPVVAVAAFQMCSAAYWLASCATEVIAAPSAQVGSIGVLSIHEDLSRMLDQLGVKVSIVSAGKYKAAGNPTAPLSPEDRARIQRSVDRSYGLFVRDVSRGRRVSDKAVRTGFGEGAVVDADDALAAGMVDQIATLDETLARVAATPPVMKPARTPATPTTSARALTDGSQLAQYQQQQRARMLSAPRR